MNIFKKIAMYSGWAVLILALIIGWVSIYDTISKETAPVLVTVEEPSTSNTYEAYFNTKYVVETRYYTNKLGEVVEYCMLYNDADSEWNNVEISMDKETYECLNYSIDNPSSEVYEFTILLTDSIITLVLVDKD